jgi:hypothetical protein
VDRLMSGRSEERPLPSPVAALLGPATAEHGGAGGCRVVSGGGLVAKVGPPELVARETAVLRARLPVAVPAVVDAGPGWLVTRAEDDMESSWSDDELAAALADLARLHDAFEGAVPERLSGVLRRPFSAAGADALLEPARRFLRSDAGPRPGVPPLPPLARMLDDPAPLLAAAASEPPALLHGDPWPGNVLRPAPARRVWVDWELASVGPAAADVASWRNQAPWLTGRPGPGVDAYLAARSRPVDAVRFTRALDAAAVLWFLADDVLRLDRVDPGRAAVMTADAEAAARRVASG